MENIKIYQIEIEKDPNKVAFLHYDKAMGIAGKIDPSIYKQVFLGSLHTANNLEDIFMELNAYAHPLLRGHSLSTSDVVVTDEGAFYCDHIGFKKIDFDESLVNRDEEVNRVVYVEPGQKPFLTEIGKKLEDEQAAVCGMIELVYNDDDTIIVCNEEAKLIGMPGNRHYGAGGIIAGPFFVIGDDGEDFRSLTDDEVEKYLKKYETPEVISQEEVEEDTGYMIFAY